MNLFRANKAIEAAICESERLAVRSNIAVVDAGANLVAFARMDNSPLGTVDISIKKAKTAVLFQVPTGELSDVYAQSLRGVSQVSGAMRSVTGPNGFGGQHFDLLSNTGATGDVITISGGVPIFNAARVLIGGIGVSSGGNVNTCDLRIANVGKNAAK